MKIIKKAIEILNSPFPFKTGKKEILQSSFFFGVFVFFFTLFFRTDQFNTDNNSIKGLYSFYYFLIVTLGMIINGAVNFYTTPKESIDNWKVRQEIWVYGIHTITIAISVFFLSNLLQLTQLSVKHYLYSVIATFIIGMIPLSIYTLFRCNKLLRTHLKDMQAIMAKLNTTEQENTTTNPVIETKMGKIPINDILAIESVRNYVIIRLPEKEIKYRSTIKQLEETLSPHSKFVRCHRAFIINTQKIQNVEGNSQGLRLFVENSEHYIPVSRANIAKLKSAIKV